MRQKRAHHPLASGIADKPTFSQDEAFCRSNSCLVRLRPRNSTVYASQGRTVMATSPDGFVVNHPEHGLWVYQSRMLSRYRWLVNGKSPLMAGNSNLQQHSWLAYYIASPVNVKDTGLDESAPAQQTIELRLSRQIGPGLHEDVDVTNFSRFSIPIRLELEVESDFADPKEIARYAGVTLLKPDEFRKQFEYLVNAEAPPLALGH